MLVPVSECVHVCVCMQPASGACTYVCVPMCECTCACARVCTLVYVRLVFNHIFSECDINPRRHKTCTTTR
jgi:hypothetical protein